MMRPSERFRRQHEELLELALEIEAALAAPDFPRNAREVRRMMARLKGKLTVHSSMENEALYPRLLEHSDPTTRALSKDLFDELGGIYDTFAAHHTRWTSVEGIEAEPAAYARHTREIFEKLKTRMERENTELYPLADREGSDAVPSSRSPS
jgi:iron-sulfur cluster repair protein YtfE (RIC family)